MNFSQFRRLTIVLFLPLLLLGFIHQKYEVFFGHHFYQECYQGYGGYSGGCVLFDRVKKREISDKTFNYDPNKINTRIHLLYRYFRDVAVLLEDIHADIEILEYDTSAKGLVQGFLLTGRQTNIKSYIPQQPLFINSCYLDLIYYPEYYNNQDYSVWKFSCGSSVIDHFKFLDKEQERYFLRIFDELRNNHIKASNLHRWLYYFYVSIPLVTYFLIAFLVWLLRRLFLFVKGPDNKG